jgi:hypothetical protein
MTADWFRNTTWDESVERAFEQRLSRARKKSTYLCIQAYTLARSHPTVALRLLDRYFVLLDDSDRAQAYVARASAYLAIGRVDEAIASYESALAQEVAYPHVFTQAYLDLPYLIATGGMRERYDQALYLLQDHERRLAFPVDRFRWLAAHALIASQTGLSGDARSYADAAVGVASVAHSGPKLHGSMGLVTEEYDAVISKLEAMAKGGDGRGRALTRLFSRARSKIVFRRKPPLQDDALNGLSHMFISCPDDPTPGATLLETGRLDFSVESLAAVDEFLDEIRRRELSPEAMSKVVLRCGAYVGEVVRLNSLQAEYHWLDYSGAVDVSGGLATFGDGLGAAAVLWDGGSGLAFPLAKVMKFIELGRADSVQTFAAMMIAKRL